MTRAKSPTKEHPETIINNVFRCSSGLEVLMRPGRMVRAPRLFLAWNILVSTFTLAPVCVGIMNYSPFIIHLFYNPQSLRICSGN